MTSDPGHQKFKLTKENLVILLSVTGGVIYNSWPLGFILDPSTAKNFQASQLETIGHPYYRLFIAGDIISSLLIVIAAAVIWVYFIKKLELRLLAIGLSVFGIFTTVSALLPANCSITSYFRCGPGYSHGLGLDLVFSGLAIAGLLLALFAFLIRLSRAQLLKTRLYLSCLVITVLWVLSLIIFSILAVQQVHAANIAQYIELSLAGLAIVMLSVGLRASRS